MDYVLHLSLQSYVSSAEAQLSEHPYGVPTKWNLFIKHNPLGSLEREVCGCQPGYSLEHLIPELKQREWVLKDFEASCWDRQDNIACG